jgi:hypothetical protein
MCWTPSIIIPSRLATGVPWAGGQLDGGRNPRGKPFPGSIFHLGCSTLDVRPPPAFLAFSLRTPDSRKLRETKFPLFQVRSAECGVRSGADKVGDKVNSPSPQPSLRGRGSTVSRSGLNFGFSTMPPLHSFVRWDQDV